PNLLAQVDDALEARELIKGSVQQNCELTAREASIQLCEKMNAEGVSILGRKFVIYRPSKENKKIEL
ncbi:MAG: YhbY family RNA-binding protein, partial [Christensenellaceae bacterium]